MSDTRYHVQWDNEDVPRQVTRQTADDLVKGWRNKGYTVTGSLLAGDLTCTTTYGGTATIRAASTD